MPPTAALATLDPASLVLGQPVIDDEHRQLCALFNSLLAGGGDLGGTILHLDEYSRLHFTIEEEFMRVYGWPGFADHRRMHREFSDQVMNLRRMQLPSDGKVPRTVLAWVRNWLVGHIDVEDRAVVAFLAGRGA
ncbi:MAG: hemerythrin family protein [Planctomycetes bacterium]|nr:hemerythrin family protein [Planctomycetota bacterium]